MNFIQNQILGMQWLSTLVSRMLTALGLDVESRIGGSVQFFIYDVVKITILLLVLIFFISYIQSYFPPERCKHIMARFGGFGARVVADLLGTVTPFCSCSSSDFYGIHDGGPSFRSDVQFLDIVAHG